MSRWLALLAGAVLLAGCEEELTVPGRCPELCPGGQPVVRDTVVLALEGSDTAFAGYTGHTSIISLLVSNQLEAGETRSWIRFGKRVDSITVVDTVRTYTTDSVVFTFPLLARDTLVDGVKLYLHRVPLTFDSLTTFAQVEEHLVPATLIDSVAIPDSLRTGTIRLVITDSTEMANLIPPSDSGKLAFGIRLAGDAPTGVRLGAISSNSGGATFTTFARVAVADTARQHQTLNVSSEANDFVRAQEPALDPDLLYVGRVPSTRSFIRFPIPDFFHDSSVVLVRATLVLTPADTIFGLKGDAAALEVRGVVKDVGAKSTPSFLVSSSESLPIASEGIFNIDVLPVVTLWRGTSVLPPTLLLTMIPDGGSFHEPVFRSTRAALGKPELHITYVRPSQVEEP